MTTSDSRVLRSETKRRRLEATRTTSDSSSQALPILPAAPHHTFPFHRKLQEHAFSRLSDLLSRHEFLLADLAKTLTSLNTVAAAQTVHRQTMTDSLGNVNSILSLAAALTQSTQTRTGEATQISTDIQSFIARWAQYMSDVRKPGTDLAPLSQTAEELWAGGGALWDGLFEGIEFDGTKDDQKEWEEAVASVASIDDGGNLPPIADNYNAVLAMFDEQFGSTRDLTAGFRKAVARIVRSVATVLLVKMAELERDLKVLNERAAEMRRANTDLWATWTELDERGNAAKQNLADINEELPTVDSKVEDYVLQLVVLAKGE